MYGVKRDKRRNGTHGGAPFEARLWADGKYIYLGSFDTERDAGKAVDMALIQHDLEPRNNAIR